MSMKIYAVQRYAIQLGNSKRRVGPVNYVESMARIICHTENNPDLGDLELEFMEGEVWRKYELVGRRLYLGLSSQYYAFYVDLLRNEKPIRFVQDPQTKEWAFWSHWESVGEGPGEDT